MLGEYTYPDGTVQDKTGMTSARGLVRFLIKTNQSGLYHFCVTDLQKSGYQYVPGDNEAPACKTVTVTPQAEASVILSERGRQESRSEAEWAASAWTGQDRPALGVLRSSAVSRAGRSWDSAYTPCASRMRWISST